MQYENYYETSDLGLATALVAIGQPIAGIEKSNPRRAIFLFVSNDTVKEAVNDYWQGCLDIPAHHYFETIKRVKSRLYG